MKIPPQRAVDMFSMPRTAEEVLAIAPDDIPETLRALLQSRGLSELICELHAAATSADATVGARARDALVHLGFVV